MFSFICTCRYRVVDSARRLCADHQIVTTEIWAYHALGDQIRFTPVQRAPQAVDGKGRSAAETREPAAPAKPAAAKPAASSRARGVATTDGPSRCEVGGQIHRAFQAASRGCAYQEFGDIEAR